MGLLRKSSFCSPPSADSEVLEHPGTVVSVFLVVCHFDRMVFDANDTYLAFNFNNSIRVNILNSAFIRLGEKRKSLCGHRTKHMNEFHFLAATCVTRHIGEQHFFSVDPVMGLNKLLF